MLQCMLAVAVIVATTAASRRAAQVYAHTPWTHLLNLGYNNAPNDSTPDDSAVV